MELIKLGLINTCILAKEALKILEVAYEGISEVKNLMTTYTKLKI